MASQEEIEEFIHTLDLLSAEVESEIDGNDGEEPQSPQTTAEVIVRGWLGNVTTTTKATKLGRSIGRELFAHISKADKTWMEKIIVDWLEELEQKTAYEMFQLMLPHVRDKWGEEELSLMEKRLLIQAFTMSARAALSQMMMARQVKEVDAVRTKAM